MTITDLIPVLRGTGTRRAVDEVDRLREENAKLLERQAAADDFFESQDKLITDLEADVRKLKVRAETAEQTIEQLKADNRRLRAELAPHRAAEANANAVDVPPMERDTTAVEDQATAPIEVLTLRQAFGTNPAHVPSWARDTDTRPLPKAVAS
ncbi:hypothetical protein OG785_45200 [Streptomyces sp. NBC_00006]|uniref:hypothetical protein n=1 Tax=Streptomyces sp. NBC_00006 TaxID=2975619 RepID=UPI00224F5DC0|nr:hypothetical protein [Streptomyces sp. NBC_00006]MCX5529011.1 hypothetical protein [Streptomyces sp. NBC_00006]MCX5537757.1 hypothetical protein [Streptomyces sp. NBC_00006]